MCISNTNEKNLYLIIKLIIFKITFITSKVNFLCVKVYDVTKKAFIFIYYLN